MSIKLDAEQRDSFEACLARGKLETTFDYGSQLLRELVDTGTKGTVNYTDYELVSGTLQVCPSTGIEPDAVAERALLDDKDIAVLSRDEDIRLHWNHWIDDLGRHYGVNLQTFDDEDDLWEAMLRHCTGIQYFDTG